MMRIYLLCSWLLLLLLPVTEAHPHYQELIPNGNNVPHPCKPNYRWPGVGHNNVGGGGANNKFGLDFKSNGHTWNKTVCSLDSDGDKLTNGEELGDPFCKWKPGQIPDRTVNITHPGVCEPHNSSLCAGKNDFLDCTVATFEGCEAVKGPEVTRMDLKFNETSVPAKVTSYYCMTFDLDYDMDYHIIANEPLVDNHNVLHHMLLYACIDGQAQDYPQPCGMTYPGCPLIISGWTVGLAGQCFGPKSGYRIGPGGYKRVVLQVHYNNPQRLSTYSDQSGMRFHIQPAIPEVQDMVTFVTGQTILTIPPGKRLVQHVGVCPSSCTEQILTKPLYVKAAINHMHYLGRSMKIELIRNGTLIANITNEDYYSYDSPLMVNYDTPLEIRPGDHIKTTCNYNSLSSDKYVYFGDGTSDEMCYGFLYTYPSDAFVGNTFCDSYGPISACQTRGLPVDGCDWKAFEIFSDPTIVAMADNMADLCSEEGYCRPECRRYLDTIKSHPCLSGDMAAFIKYRLKYSYKGLQFLSRLNSCNQNCTESTDNQQQGTQSANNNIPFSSVLLLLAIFAVMYSTP